jgi:hypothetical protein
MLVYHVMYRVLGGAFFSQAWNKRLGTTGLGPSEILQCVAYLLFLSLAWTGQPVLALASYVLMPHYLFSSAQASQC